MHETRFSATIASSFPSTHIPRPGTTTQPEMTRRPINSRVRAVVRTSSSQQQGGCHSLEISAIPGRKRAQRNMKMLRGSPCRILPSAGQLSCIQQGESCGVPGPRFHIHRGFVGLRCMFRSVPLCSRGDRKEIAPVPLFLSSSERQRIHCAVIPPLSPDETLGQAPHRTRLAAIRRIGAGHVSLANSHK